MARRHLHRLLTACALLVLFVGAPPVVAHQALPPRPAQTQLGAATVDEGDGVRLVDDAVRAESAEREGTGSAAVGAAAGARTAQCAWSGVVGHDRRFGRVCGADAAPRAPPPAV